MSFWCRSRQPYQWCWFLFPWWFRDGSPMLISLFWCDWELCWSISGFIWRQISLLISSLARAIRIRAPESRFASVFRKSAALGAYRLARFIRVHLGHLDSPFSRWLLHLRPRPSWIFASLRAVALRAVSLGVAVAGLVKIVYRLYGMKDHSSYLD